LPAFLSRQHRHIDEHILQNDPVSRGGIVDEDMRHGSDDLAVLNDRRAAHECGQVGTTVFHGLFTNIFKLTNPQNFDKI